MTQACASPDASEPSYIDCREHFRYIGSPADSADFSLGTRQCRCSIDKQRVRAQQPRFTRSTQPSDADFGCVRCLSDSCTQRYGTIMHVHIHGAVVFEILYRVHVAGSLMDGSTDTVPFDSASPMLTEGTKQVPNGDFPVPSAPGMAPSVAPDSANSMPVLEQASRRWSRPVKGRSCGAHVVAQLQISSTLACASHVSAKSTREHDEAGATENCTPPQLARTTSHMEACESAAMALKEPQTADDVPSPVPRLGSDHPSAVIHRTTASTRSGPNFKRRNSRSLGAAMMATFAPQRTPDLPSSKIHLAAHPASEYSMQAGAGVMCSQVEPVTTNTSQSGDPSRVHKAAALPPAGAFEAAVELGQTSQTAHGDSAPITTAAAEHTLGGQVPFQSAQKAAVKPVRVTRSSAAVALAAEQVHGTCSTVALGTASAKKVMQDKMTAESSGPEPAVVHTPVPHAEAVSGPTAVNSSPINGCPPACSAVQLCRRPKMLSMTAAGDKHLQHASLQASQSTAKMTRGRLRLQQAQGAHAQQAAVSGTASDGAGTFAAPAATQNDCQVAPLCGHPTLTAHQTVPESKRLDADPSAQQRANAASAPACPIAAVSNPVSKPATEMGARIPDPAAAAAGKDAAVIPAQPPVRSIGEATEVDVVPALSVDQVAEPGKVSAVPSGVCAVAWCLCLGFRAPHPVVCSTRTKCSCSTQHHNRIWPHPCLYSLFTLTSPL